MWAGGVVEKERGRYTEAHRLHQGALLLRTNLLGKRHPDTISSIGSLAGCIHAQGD